MGLADRIDSLWQVFRADSPPGARLRRRVAAIAAMVAFLLALLATVGFLRVTLGVIAVVVVSVGIAVLVLVCARYTGRLAGLGAVGLRRMRSLAAAFAAALSRRASQLARSASRAVVSVRRSAAAHLPAWRDRCRRTQTAAGRHLTAAAVGARRRTHAATSQLPELRNRYGRIQGAASRQLAAATSQTQRHMQTAAAAVRARRDASPMPTPAATETVAPDREALRANAVGAQLRRDGAYAEAAEQHRAALAIFRGLGDRRSEALTLNNLALALDRADDPAALELFEQAAAILAELGEEQREGEVIANLALAFRRRGSEERSAEVLEIALGKLNPESPAYRKVEGLRRAS